MLRTHYRQPIDWTVKALEEAEATLDRWYEAVGDVEPGEQICRRCAGRFDRRPEYAGRCRSSFIASLSPAIMSH